MTITIASQIAQLRQSIATVIKGKDEAIGLAIVALLARGHLLIEDVPGVGKTTLAHALARSFNCSFQRIQFTSDLLPSDVVGISVFNQTQNEFEFRPGPVFANIVLADEINRTTPKTQSALLEAMNEAQVTMDGRTHALPQPFMVMATQNPLSTTAPIRCRNRSSIASCCASAWATPPGPVRKRFCATTAARHPWMGCDR